MLLGAVTQPVTPGQVVLVHGARGWVLHRVWQVAQDGCVVTRGDACVRADPPVTLRAVQRVVLLVERNGQRQAVPAARPSWRMRWRRLRSRLLPSGCGHPGNARVSPSIL